MIGVSWWWWWWLSLAARVDLFHLFIEFYGLFCVKMNAKGNEKKNKKEFERYGARTKGAVMIIEIHARLKKEVQKVVVRTPRSTLRK